MQLAARYSAVSATGDFLAAGDMHRSTACADIGRLIKGGSNCWKPLDFIPIISDNLLLNQQQGTSDSDHQKAGFSHWNACAPVAYYYVAAKATYIRLLHGKIGSFWGWGGGGGGVSALAP